MQLLTQSRSVPVASQPVEAPAVAVSAGSALAETAGAATADDTLPTSAATGIPRPSAAQDWRSKHATADSAIPGNATVSGGSAMAGTQASSQMLDAYSSEFAWMRSLPAPASASAPPPAAATAAEAQPSAQGISLPAVPVGHGDGERLELLFARQCTPASIQHCVLLSCLCSFVSPCVTVKSGHLATLCFDAADELWDMEIEPKPRRSAARRSDNAAPDGSGSRGGEANRPAAADVSAAPVVPTPGRHAGSPAGDIGIDAIGGGSRGGGGVARPRKRKAAEVQDPQERLARQLRGHGRAAAGNGNGASNGLRASAALTPASEVNARV